MIVKRGPILKTQQKTDENSQTVTKSSLTNTEQPQKIRQIGRTSNKSQNLDKMKGIDSQNVELN